MCPCSASAEDTGLTSPNTGKKSRSARGPLQTLLKNFHGNQKRVKFHQACGISPDNKPTNRYSFNEDFIRALVLLDHLQLLSEEVKASQLRFTWVSGIVARVKDCEYDVQTVDDTVILKGAVHRMYRVPFAQHNGCDFAALDSEKTINALKGYVDSVFEMFEAWVKVEKSGNHNGVPPDSFAAFLTHAHNVLARKNAEACIGEPSRPGTSEGRRC